MRKKFSEVQTKRSILKSIPKTTHSNVIKAGIGCDYARLLLLNERETECGAGSSLNVSSNEIAVAERVSIVENENIADIRYDVIKLYNNLRAAGYIPFAMTDSIIMPSDDEKYMKKILRSLSDILKVYGVDIIAGHTEISDAVNKPIITMTMSGRRKICGAVSLDPSNMRAGMDIVMCGQTGVMGTIRLLEKYKEGLLTRYSKTYLNGVYRLESCMAIGHEADIAIQNDICYSHDISTGGVYAALWELADAADVGIDINHDAIPILQETIEIYEYTGHNPYMIDGSGAALFVTENGEVLSDSLYKAGFEASVIGHATGDRDRTIIHDDEKRFLTPPKYDDI
ncbi:MAG: AIR synthase-related protein [Coprococcus sp.]